MEKVENKMSDSFLNYPNNKVTVLLEAMKDLQRHVEEFDKVVTDYKKTLDLTEHLQEMTAEVPSSCSAVRIVTLSQTITLILESSAALAIIVIKSMYHAPFCDYFLKTVPYRTAEPKGMNVTRF